MRSHFRLVPAAAGVALVFLGGCAGGGGNAGAATQTAKSDLSARVTVKDFAFSPKTIRVRVGGTVTWTNKDAFDHSVQADSAGFTGPKFGPETMPSSFSHRFDKPGTYPYICGVHNSMTGTVIVTT